MFLRLLSVETTRLTRRALPWLSMLACAVFAGLSMQNFYSSNSARLLSGEQKMPGLSFELANSLDSGVFLAASLLIILTAIQMGSDYSQRTNQHWLMRAPRHTGLLAKFAVLVGFTFLIQLATMLGGALVGWYYKAFFYHAFTWANLNLWQMLAAPFYMTLAYLPYLALILLITVLGHSAFAGALIGLAWSQFIEILITSFLYGRPFMAWHPRNLGVSLTFLLNRIGNRVVAVPDNLAQPLPAALALAAYTLAFLGIAAWLYRRQDLGG